MSKQSDLVSVSQGASGDPLFIDTENNRVGVGTSLPLARLQASTAGTSTTPNTNVVARFVTNGSDADAHIQLSNGVDHSANIGIAGGANLYFATDGAERMRIDNAGRVTTPYQPAFSAYVTAGGVTSGSLVYTNPLVNTGGHYNAANGLFTAPVAGTYVFHSTTFGNTGAGTTAYFYTQFIKNGGAVGPYAHSQYNDARSYETVTDAIILSLAANDNVGVYFLGGNGASEYGGVYSHFSGHLIG